MKTILALFRGINVGGRNLLPMKSLIPLLEQHGCHHVKTYIQTGNVVFQSDKAPGNIGKLIESNFGFMPEVLYLEKQSFEQAVSNNPYRVDSGKEVHFYFCKDAPNLNLEKINALKKSTEQYTLIDKVFYLHAPDGIGRSKLVANLEKCLGVSATGRNLNTVNKLIKMLEVV